MATRRIQYIGAFDEVHIPAADQAVKAGEVIELDAALADSLLEQEANWAPADATKKGAKGEAPSAS